MPWTKMEIMNFLHVTPKKKKKRKRRRRIWSVVELKRGWKWTNQWGPFKGKGKKAA